MSQIHRLLEPKKNALQRIVEILVERQSEDGVVLVTRAYLAEHAECSKGAVPRILRQLAHAGIISKQSMVNDIGLSVGMACTILPPELRALAKAGRQAEWLRCSATDEFDEIPQRRPTAEASSSISSGDQG